MNSDNHKQIKFPKSGAAQEIANWSAHQRQKNFRDVIKKTKLIEFVQMSSCDEPSSFGIQWFSEIQTPSRLVGYPDQSYRKTHSLVFMAGNKRFGFTTRGKKMPYVNFETYLEWRKYRVNQVSTL